MVGLAQKIQHLYPNSVSLQDWRVENNGSGPRVAHWNPALGAQPTQAQLDAITDQQVADAIKARKDAAEPDLATLRNQAQQAVADIDTFLAIASPNNAAVLAEVRAIDRRQKAIIKALVRLASERL